MEFKANILSIAPIGGTNTYKFRLETLKAMEDRYSAMLEERQQYSQFFESEDDLLDKLDELKLHCRTGDFERVRQLVDGEGVPINTRDRWDAVPLYYACLCGQTRVVQFLLSKGARCEENTFDGERCLYAAHSLEIKKLLREFKVVIKTDPFHEFLRRSFNSPKYYPDVKFIIKGKEVLAHKAVLCARCPYFTEQFEGRWKNRRTISLNHSLLHPEAFIAVVRFLYTGRIEFPSEMLSHVRLMCKQIKLEEIGDILQRKFNYKPEIEWIVYDESIKKTPSALQRDLNNHARRVLKVGKEIVEENGKQEVKKDETIELLSDTILRVHGVDFHVNKMFVCGRCEYFKTLMTGNFRDSSLISSSSDERPCYKVTSISKEVFDMVLQYLYSDYIEELNGDYVDELLEASDLFILPGLKSQCIAILQQNVDTSNVFDMITLARTFNATRLEDHCIFYMAKNLIEIIENDKDRLAELIRENAASIKRRQETDSVPIVDEIRSHLDIIYEVDNLSEDNVKKLQTKQKSMRALDTVLDYLGLDI